MVLSFQNPHTEKELLLQIASGSEVAFRQIFDRYWDNIYSVAFSFTKSNALSEEIVQDVFLKVWISKEQLITITKFEDWLFIVARNHIYNVLRKKVYEQSFEEHLLEYFGEASDTTWQQLVFKESDRLVEEAVSQLPPQQQTIYRLSRNQGLSHDEIAAQLNISKNTLKVHMNKALHFIKNYLHQHSAEIILIIVGSAIK